MGRGRWRTLIDLRLPAALPYFLGGLRISGGLALIGTVVAEFVAGSGGRKSGLAYRILGVEAINSRSRACSQALVLISLAGIAIYLVLSLLSHLLLRRWHEKARSARSDPATLAALPGARKNEAVATPAASRSSHPPHRRR